jgi:hypothetical protein
MRAEYQGLIFAAPMCEFDWMVRSLLLAGRSVHDATGPPFIAIVVILSEVASSCVVATEVLMNNAG